MKLRLFHWFVLAWLSVSISWAQEIPQAQTETTSTHSSSFQPNSPVPKTTAQDVKPPRIFWIIPTYKVTESKIPTALTPHQKLRIVLNDLADPYTIGYTGLMAGIAQANNDFPSYGQGAAGYWKRYGAAYTDQASAGFLGGFLIPSIRCSRFTSAKESNRSLRHALARRQKGVRGQLHKSLKSQTPTWRKYSGQKQVVWY